MRKMMLIALVLGSFSSFAANYSIEKDDTLKVSCAERGTSPSVTNTASGLVTIECIKTCQFKISETRSGFSGKSYSVLGLYPALNGFNRYGSIFDTFEDAAEYAEELITTELARNPGPCDQVIRINF